MNRSSTKNAKINIKIPYQPRLDILVDCTKVKFDHILLDFPANRKKKCVYIFNSIIIWDGVSIIPDDLKSWKCGWSDFNIHISLFKGFFSHRITEYAKTHVLKRAKYAYLSCYLHLKLIRIDIKLEGWYFATVTVLF